MQTSTRLHSILILIILFLSRFIDWLQKNKIQIKHSHLLRFYSFIYQAYFSFLFLLLRAAKVCKNVWCSPSTSKFTDPSKKKFTLSVLQTSHQLVLFTLLIANMRWGRYKSHRICYLQYLLLVIHFHCAKDFSGFYRR